MKKTGELRCGIRGYGPGKFDTILDSYLYEIALSDADVEGDVNEIGIAYSLLEGYKELLQDIDAFARDSKDSLTYDEKQEILRLSKGGVILIEDDQGFVSSEYFYSREELDDAWYEVQAKLAAYWEDVESDEP